MLGAINLAKKAASSLETKPLSQATANKFRQILGQGPLDHLLASRSLLAHYKD
jgi:hypothetical protein